MSHGADAVRLIHDLNALLLVLPFRDLRVVLPLLAAMRLSVTTRLLDELEKAGTQSTDYMKAAEASRITGYSRSFLYEHGENLGIAVRPEGCRGVRFPRDRVERWMQARLG